MRYVSVCAGIEAASVAWHPFGWEPVLFSEIEPFPCAVLKHHYPEVPLVGDFTQLIANPPEADLLVGGTPCQAFSVAGKRLSLEDYRGNLSLAFADLFHAGQYRWAVWENVPGVLSTKDNAFGCFLGRMVGSDTPLLPGGGNKWTNAGVVSGPQATAAWRVLDAQYFGVAQRRRRVFVCVSRGAGFQCARALLPVGESLSRHPPARPEKGKGIAADASDGIGGCGEVGTYSTPAIGDIRADGVASTLSANSGGGGETQNAAFVLDVSHTISAKWAKQSGGTAGGTEINNLVVQGGGWPADIAPTLNAAFGEKQGLEDQHINGGAGMFVLDKQGAQVTEHVSPTLKTDLLATNNDQVVFAIQNPTLEKQQNGLGVSDGPMYTLEPSRPHGVFAGEIAPTVSQGPPYSRTGNERVEAEALVVADLRPRRLTPEECEKLQGFLPGYTNIPWKGKASPDGPRYKALGNSMAVPCMFWIGRRIQLVEDGQC